MVLNIFMIIPNYIQKHWQGQLNLATSFWVNLVLIFILWQSVIHVIHGTISNESGREDILRYVSLIIPVLIISPLLFLWQGVGAWRAGSHVKSKILGLTSKTMIMLFGFVVSAQLLLHYVPTKQYLKIALGMDHVSIEGYEIKVQGKMLIVLGAFDYGLPKEIKSRVLANEKIKTIWLESSGGHVNVAHKVAEFISKKKLNTYVAYSCHSACTIAFLAGTKRMMTSYARLGFHHPYMPGIPRYVLEHYTVRDRNFMLNRGVKSSFIDKAFAMEPETLWFPDPEELINSGFVTNISDKAE